MKVAFIGHRKVENTEALKLKLTYLVTALIVKENADTFLFGSNSKFDDLSYETVTKLKEIYPQIRRVYVRASDEYLSHMCIEATLKYYEETFFPESVHNAGYRSYIKRNQAMIDMCDILVTYFNKDYTPYGKSRISRNSGTSLAVEYAEKKEKRIINLYEQD